MKLLKRFGAALITVLTLAAMLTGTALAAEPARSAIGVQLDGKALSFTDAVPEVTDSRTFLPFRAVLEAMGAQVDYDAETRTVSARREGVTIAMVPGQKEMTITENGQTRTLEMDVAPYVKTPVNRTYVPVRYAAEAFGYSVGWDSRSRTVIIVDVDALFGNASFTLMDSFAAYCAQKQTGDNVTLAGNLSLNVTDKTGAKLSAPLAIGGSVEGIAGEKGAQLTGKFRLTGLSELVQLFGQDASPMELMLLQTILGSLSELSAEVRMDMDNRMIYLSLPAELTGAENAWYSVDLETYRPQLLSALDMTQLTQPKDAGIRDSLVWVMKSVPLNSADTSYASLAMMAELYTDLLSDQAFTQSGNTYTARMTLEDVVNLTVTLTKRGKDIVSADVRMDADVEEDGTRMTMVMTEHAAPGKVTAKMSMTVEDEEASTSLDMDLSCVPTGKAPVTTPPAGAQIVPMG